MQVVAHRQPWYHIEVVGKWLAASKVKHWSQPQVTTCKRAGPEEDGHALSTHWKSLGSSSKVATSVFRFLLWQWPLHTNMPLLVG